MRVDGFILGADAAYGIDEAGGDAGPVKLEAEGEGRQKEDNRGCAHG
jgi:hypothetical protein